MMKHTQTRSYMWTHAAMVMSTAAISVLATTQSVSAQEYMYDGSAYWAAPTTDYAYDWGAYDYTNDYGYDDALAYTDTYTHDAGGSMFDTAAYAQPAAVIYTQGDGGYYAADGHWHVPGYVHKTSTVNGKNVFQCGPGDSRWRPDELGQTQYYLDGTPANSRTPLTDGSTSTTVTNTVRPACRLYPKSTNTQTVILEWVTQGATTAFLDNGIGHVSLGTGGRMVTPTQSTVYTMTVVNERGASAQCAANIVVQGTAPTAAKTLTVSQNGVQQFGTTPPTPTTNPTSVVYDANGTVIDAAANEANRVGGNVLTKITDTIGGGQSIWERIRTVSMVALGVFFVLYIVVFVMRRVFGGGGEAKH